MFLACRATDVCGHTFDVQSLPETKGVIGRREASVETTWRRALSELSVMWPNSPCFYFHAFPGRKAKFRGNDSVSTRHINSVTSAIQARRQQSEIMFHALTNTPDAVLIQLPRS